MQLWVHWCMILYELRPACSRIRTFLWLSTCLVGITIRGDLLGITSIVRALGLQAYCYDRLLDFFHSRALNLEKLTIIWTDLMLKVHPLILRANGRLLLVGDGLKVSKAGRKMPAVKQLHQQSNSNTKPAYIMGHSCQAIGILAGTLESVFAIPLISRIQEGIVCSNRDKRTLLDKMILLINSLGIKEKFYFIADAYYAARNVINGLLVQGNHLISRVKSNAVAYYPAEGQTQQKGPGRPKKYGKKIRLRTLIHTPEAMHTAQSPIYGEKGVHIKYRCLDLLWRSVGILVRFVIVIHPARGAVILLCTDLTLSPLEIIRLYGLRFKIEISFKQAIRTLGVYAYHFWMRTMIPLRRSSGDQYLHRKTEGYRKAVNRKIDAYHRHIQIGIIAQGLLQYLSSAFPKLVWSSFGSWIRTIRPGMCPSEQVTSIAMRNSFPEFLANSSPIPILKKFLCHRIDLTRSEGLRMIA